MDTHVRWIAVALALGAFVNGCAMDTTSQANPEAVSMPIVGGNPATEAQLYSTVALIDTTVREVRCTGTLIAPTVVVSAAHCLEDIGERNLAVSAGLFDFTAPPDNAIYEVSAIVPHEDRNWDSLGDPQGLAASHDLLLLILATPIMTLPVAPVLPMSQVDEKLTHGTPMIIAGFGSRDVAATLYGQLYIAETPYDRRSDFEFIAGGPDSPDTCLGDSGGPAYADVDGTIYLIGATSRGVNASARVCGDGGIFTLLPAYQLWMFEHSGGAYTPPVEPGPVGTGGTGGTGATGGLGGSEGTGEAGGISSAPTARNATGVRGGCSIASAREHLAHLWIVGLVFVLGIATRRWMPLGCRGRNHLSPR